MQVCERVEYKGRGNRIRTVREFEPSKWAYGYLMPDGLFYPLSRPFTDENAAWNCLQELANMFNWEKKA